MNGGERRERGKGSGGSKGVRTPYDIMKGKEVTVQSIGGRCLRVVLRIYGGISSFFLIVM